MNDHPHHHTPSSRERIHQLARRRRRVALVKSLGVFLVVAGGFTALVVLSWDKIKKTGIFDAPNAGSRDSGRDPESYGYEGGFHVVDHTYWVLFDEAGIGGFESTPPPKAPTPRSGGGTAERPTPPRPPKRPDPVPRRPGKEQIKAEGLTVKAMRNQGPYTINGDMGGLIATRVGVWKSPNKLGTGRIAFYCEHLEEVAVTHWAKNYMGFRVYRVVKDGRAGWLLGPQLMTDDGTPFK